MHDEENEWHNNPDGDNTEGAAEQQQVPPTLLPNVLQRLGLAPGQAPSDFELSIDDLIAKLKSDRWEERVVAVRALGKLEMAVPIEMFVPILHDEDPTVRAATVHLLGNMGRRTPLHWLVEALQDPDWQVREVAVLALGKQGQRVPNEVLMTALHDTDGSVREAARFALQWNSLAEKTSYGRLWEEKPMQREQYDTALSNDKHNSIPFENVPYDGWNGTIIEYSGNSHSPHGVREQAQAYAARQYTPGNHTPQEAPSYEYAEAGVMPSRGEKITSYRIRGKSHKGWWAAIIITAILFLGLGQLSAFLFMPHIRSFGTGSKGIQSVVAPAEVFPFGNLTYAPIMQKELSSLLHLTPQQIIEQLKMRGSLSAVATAQDITASQLRDSELRAATQIVNAALASGDIGKEQAGNLTQQLQNNPAFLEKATLTSLEAAPLPN